MTVHLLHASEVTYLFAMFQNDFESSPQRVVLLMLNDTATIYRKAAAAVTTPNRGHVIFTKQQKFQHDWDMIRSSERIQASFQYVDILAKSQIRELRKRRRRRRSKRRKKRMKIQFQTYRNPAVLVLIQILSSLK